MQGQQFDGLVLDAELLTGRRKDGTLLRFTRQERSLLSNFVQNPGRLQTRAKLLDVLSRDDLEVSERNVDIVVSRLRSKLGDPARNSRYIATQYGEGYMWVAQALAEAVPIDAFVVLGPIHGLPDVAGRETALMSALARTLRQLAGRSRRVVEVLDWPDGNLNRGNVAFSLDASFHRDGGILHAAFVLRHEPTRRPLVALRRAFAGDDDRRDAEALARLVWDGIWSHLALPGRSPEAPRDLPMELRLHEATRTLAASRAAPTQVEDYLERAWAVRPDDAELAIVTATNLYARLVLPAGIGADLEDDDWQAVEANIETLVLDNLAAISGQPMLILGAAKLLLVLGHRHLSLADRLSEEAFSGSAAFAAAFSLRGQVAMGQGDFERALDLFEQAFALCDPISEFGVYLLVLRCKTLLAAGDGAALQRAAERLFSVKPEARLELGLLVAPPGTELPELVALQDRLDPAGARRMLLYAYRMSGRQFARSEHRANTLRGLVQRLAGRFGNGVVPEVVAEAVFGSEAPSRRH